MLRQTSIAVFAVHFQDFLLIPKRASKLEDDEAAFVIEACQGRLAHCKNPSAVVMTSIKGVAARVGRRYYGQSEASSCRLGCQLPRDLSLAFFIADNDENHL